MTHFEDHAEKQPAAVEQATEQLTQEAVKDTYSKPGREGTYRPSGVGVQNENASNALPGLEISSPADPGSEKAKRGLPSSKDEQNKPNELKKDARGQAAGSGPLTSEMNKNYQDRAGGTGGNNQDGSNNGRGESGGGKGLAMPKENAKETTTTETPKGTNPTEIIHKMKVKQSEEKVINKPLHKKQ